MSSIIVFEEKHTTRYFDASTPQLLSRACAIILKERSEAGWFYREYEDDEIKLSLEETAISALTSSQVAGLPEPMKTETEQKLARIERKRESFKRGKIQEDEWFSALEKVLAVPADESYLLTSEIVTFGPRRTVKPLAYLLVDNRADYQYEGYSLEDLE